MHGARSHSGIRARRRATRFALALCALTLVALCGACAAAPGPDPARPRADEPPYPVLLSSDKDRRERALNTWATLARAAGVATPPPAPELDPATATLRALPAPSAVALRLPLVEIKDGDKESADEATRESLRRFIASARDLLGVSLEDLSLVGISADKPGAGVALYQQKPFPFPLRGGYGRVEISFASDRSVVALSSTAIPDTERLARALAAARARAISADDAVKRLAGRAFNVTAAAGSGASQTYTVAAGERVEARELVVYPVARAGDPGTLELRLAWETTVGRAGEVVAYVDALTGDVLAATQSSGAGRR